MALLDVSSEQLSNSEAWEKLCSMSSRLFVCSDQISYITLFLIELTLNKELNKAFSIWEESSDFSPIQPQHIQTCDQFTPIMRKRQYWSQKTNVNGSINPCIDLFLCMVTNSTHLKESSSSNLSLSALLKFAIQLKCGLHLMFWLST